MHHGRIVRWGAGVGATLIVLGAVSASGRTPGAGDPALRFAASSHYKVRVAAAQALAERGDAAARAQLGRLARDPHPLVRLAARHALAGR